MESYKLTVLYLIALLVLSGICGLVAYAISISDLPEWFKFWLLQR